MKLVVSSDEKTPLNEYVINYLKSLGHDLTLLGDLESPNGKWADISLNAARMVASGDVDQGIIFCWSGTGACMAANKVSGARAALCISPTIAGLARKWNDANILVMGNVNTKNETAKEIIDAWFMTPFDEEGLDQAHTLDNI